MKFKIGDRVKVIYKGDVNYGKIGTITEKGYCYDWRVDFDNYDGLNDENDLELVPKTLDNLEVGDILTTEVGNKRKVLGICGEVVFLSYPNEPEIFKEGLTLKEIKDFAYKLKEDSEIVELSMDEIASKLGIPVEKLKIKEEK